MLVATGEQVSAALLAIRLQSMGHRTVSFLAFQMNLTTDSNHGRARIKSVQCDRITQALNDGQIAVVAGYQGVNPNGDITTLGRGASDLTAVALAAALKADACEIYTDVDGVYSADPNICPNAKKLGRISYDEMLEMAGLGAKVLQIRSVELARRYNVPLVVRSSFGEAEGTWVGQEDKSMEDVLVSGVTLDQNQSKITIAGVEDQPGPRGEDFQSDRGRGNRRRYDYPECQRRRPHRHDLHHRTRGFARALEIVGARPKEIGAAGVRHNDAGREGLGGRSRHAHPCGSRVHDVQGAGGGANQYRDDFDLGD